MKIDGGCFCKHVTYEAEVNPERVFICHCTDCQTLSGSAFRTVTPVPSDSFQILTGEPTAYVKTAESGARRQQILCPNCGSPIYSASVGDTPKGFNVRLVTVNQRVQLVPKVQIWSRSEQHWLAGLDAVRKIETQPG